MMKDWEIIADNLSKGRMELGLCLSDQFQTGKQSLLLTRIATMESASLCTRMKSGLRFWNWKGLFISAY
jgi:hypothetical protein